MQPEGPSSATFRRALRGAPVLRLRHEDESVLGELESRAHERILEDGEELFAANSILNGMFVVMEGTVQASDMDGRVLHDFAAGSAFAVQAALRAHVRAPVACKAVGGRTVVYTVSHESFLGVMRHAFADFSDGVRTYRGRIFTQQRLQHLAQDTCELRGIRFASAARFQMPEPYLYPASQPVVEAFSFGPVSPQVQAIPILAPTSARPSPAELVFKPKEQDASEDSLFLNVWTPLMGTAAAREAHSKLPVLVYIHGGAFMSGSGSDGIYDGREMASRGAVVVTVNYRLGALGFLCAPGTDIPMNLGLHDQIAALRWVKQHVRTFGGDPANVTVFGESAGAMSIGALLGTQLRRDEQLFQRAILQSGAALGVLNEAQARESAASFHSMLGDFLPSGEPLSVASLQALPLQAILDATHKLAVEGGFSGKIDLTYLRGIPMPFQPSYLENGPMLHDTLFHGVPPLAAVARGVASDVSIVIGCTEEEYTLFMMDGSWRKMVKRAGSRAGLLQTLEKRFEAFIYGDSRYRHHHDQSFAQQAAKRLTLELEADTLRCTQEKPGTSEALTDAYGFRMFERFNSWWLFNLPMLRLATAQWRSNGRVFAYRMDYRSPIAELGAGHAVDTMIVFGSWRLRPLQPMSGAGPETERVSGEMQGSWVRFAKTGNPGWPVWGGPARRQTRVFGGERAGVEPYPAQSVVDAWGGVCEPVAMSARL